MVNISVSQAMDNWRAEKIIQKFAAVQLKTSGHLVANVKRLPFSKQEIKDAILFAMPKVDKRMYEYLRAGYVQLGMFQNLREIEMLDIPDTLAKLPDKELYKLIEKTRTKSDWLPIQKYVLAEMQTLLQEAPKCTQ